MSSMGLQSKIKQLLGDPNVLTLFRILAVPVVVILMMMPNRLTCLIAGLLFSAAAITDYFDGYLARQKGMVSNLGKVMDPVADKLMVAIVLVMLVQAQSGWFEDIIAMIIIGREITISALREWMATIGERANVKVSFSGKVKTTLQMFGIAFMVYQHDLFGIPIYTVGFVLLVAAAVMTIWSMFFYLKAAWPFIMADQDGDGSD